MSKQPPPASTASAIGPCPTVLQIVGWLVDYGLNGPLRQYFSLYRGVVGWSDGAGLTSSAGASY